MAEKGVYFRRADNRRVARAGHMGGWNAMRERLVGDEDGRSMIYWFSTCTALIRTLPTIQHDKNAAEDLDTKSEDHAVDTARYACMSRPWTRPRQRSAYDLLTQPMTHNDMHALMGR